MQPIPLCTNVSAAGAQTWQTWVEGGRASLKIDATAWNGASAVLEARGTVDGRVIEITESVAVANRILAVELAPGSYRITITGTPTALSAQLLPLPFYRS